MNLITLYFEELIKFAESINMIPLAAKEEKSGYLLNSMFIRRIFYFCDSFDKIKCDFF